MRQIVGYDIGILVMRSWVPKPPGHISNVQNYPFPVYYHIVEDSNTTNIHGGDETVLPNIMDGVRILERYGCKAVMTSCGYFGHFQGQVASQTNLPVFLSAICMLPWVATMLVPTQKIGVICYNREKLTDDLFRSCGVSYVLQKRCVVRDIIHENELGKIILDEGHYNIGRARQEAVEVAAKMCGDEPSIGVILLECTDLPPHSAAIQKKVGLPVFDATMMVYMIHGLFVAAQ